MTGTIYGLCGPEGIRYVGQTRRKLSTRFQQHAQRARAGWAKRRAKAAA